MSTSLNIIVGGQFGSEAKGHVTKRVIDRLGRTRDDVNPIINVRVAGPNAGHCVRDERGQKFALRTIPVGAVLPSVLLHIAPGSEVDPDVLFHEVSELVAAGHRIGGRLSISGEATLLTAKHRDEEAGMQARIGSTGKGIGAARADRIMRTAKRVKDDKELIFHLNSLGIHVTDQPINYTNTHVVIEGTQGYGLGLHAGHYPQCTSSDCRAIDFAAMAGTNPWDFAEFNIWVVARVYPIRVAGNSGPLKDETSWEELGLKEELTTVTKKVRRVGGWDGPLVKAAVAANGASRVHLAITMLDQKFGNVQGLDNTIDLRINGGQILPAEALQFLSEIQDEVGGRLDLVTTGEDTGVWIR